MLLGCGVFSQTVIEGVISDISTLSPLEGAEIHIQGTNIGTTSDSTGHYILNCAANGKQYIEISYIGYVRYYEELIVNDQKSIHWDYKLTPYNISVEGVTVTADRESVRRYSSMSLTGLISKDLFHKLGAECPADALNFVTGCSVENSCNNCGSKQLRINGLDGKYSRVSINSYAVWPALGSVYVWEQIPSAAIERVEVVRGGGSAVYGASSVAGTVNIITRSPEKNLAEVSHSITGIDIDKAFDNTTNAYVSAVTDNKSAGIALYAQNRYRQGFDHNGDGFTELPMYELTSFGGQTFINSGKNSKFIADFLCVNDNRRGGDRLDYNVTNAEIAETSSHKINQGDILWQWHDNSQKNRLDIYTSIASINRKSYTGGCGNLNDPDSSADLYFSHTDEFSISSGAVYKHKYNLSSLDCQFITGFESSYDRINDLAVGFDYSTTEKADIQSVFFQNMIKIDKLVAQAGLRADRHSLIDRLIVSPQVNIKYSPLNIFDFRFVYSTGFRAPQLFEEEMHINIAGGSRYKIKAVDNLKEERGNSFSFSATLRKSSGNCAFEFTAEGFLTDIKNSFSEEYSEQTDATGCVEIIRTNSTGATVSGVNFETRTMFYFASIYAGFTYQKSCYKDPQIYDDNAPATDKFFRTPENYGFVTLDLDPFSHAGISVTGNYTGRMNVLHTTENIESITTGSFFDMGTRLHFTFHLTKEAELEIGCGIKNIFDSYQNDLDIGSQRDASYIYGPMLPRSWFADVKLIIK